MTVMMIFSTFMVYLPAFADPAPAFSGTMVEGDEVIGYYMGMIGVKHVMIENPVYEFDLEKDWIIDWWRCIPIGGHYVFTEVVEGSIEAAEINATRYLEPGSYTIVLVGDYYVDDGQDQADVLYRMPLVVTANQAPVANDDERTVTEDSVGNELNVLVNDSDPDGHPLTITGITDGPVGLTFETDKLVYTPEPDFNGVVTVTYTVSDNRQVMPEEDTAIVTITVEAVNDPPVAGQITVNADENEQILIDGLSNSDDPDLYDVNSEEALQLVSVTNPANGTVTVTGDTIYYISDIGFDGTDSFSYTISDGDLTSTADIYVNVTDTIPDDHQPVANTDTWVLFEDQHAWLNVIANDVLEDGFGHLEIVEGPAHGTAFVSNMFPGTIYYDAFDGYVGTDIVKYRVYDNDGDFAEASVILEIKNDWDNIRWIRDDKIYMEEDDFGYVNVLRNDSFRDRIEKLEIVESPKFGIATINLDGQLTYHTDESHDNDPSHGCDRWYDYIIYKVTLVTGDVGYGTVVVDVEEIDKILLGDDIKTVQQDSSNNYFNVLDNDIYVGLDAFGLYQHDVNDGPFNGTAYVSGNQIVYTPTPGYMGVDTLRYYVRDEDGWFDVASVMIYIHGEELLIVQDETMVTNEDDPITANVVWNDTLPYGFDRLEIVEGPQHGTAFVLWPGSKEIRYIPNDDYVGMDTVRYKVYGLDGQWDQGTLTIDVREGNNDIRRIRSDKMWTIEGGIVQKNVLNNDWYTADIINLSIGESPSHGIATIDQNGLVTYQADPTFDGWVEFTYKVELVSNEIGYGCVTVFIGETDKILLGDDLRSVMEDSGSNYFPVLDNDSIDAGVRHFGIYNMSPADGPFHGTVEIAFGGINYTPDENYNGPDTFRYYVIDNDGWMDIASVAVQVQPVQDVYTYKGETDFDIDKDEVLTFNAVEDLEGALESEEIGLNDSIFGPVVSAVFNYETLAFGTLDWDANGNIIYDPGNQYAGSVTIEFALYNGFGDILTGTVYVDVGLFSDNILVYLDEVTGEMPDGTIIEGFFVQQYEEFDLWEGVTYGKVDNQPITVEGATIHVIGEDGYVVPGEERIVRDGLVSLDSYGKLMIGYQVKDGSNHTGASIPRLLTVNHQPIVGPGPITPDDPWAVQATQAATYDIDIYFMQEGWDLWSEVFLYDFEEYNENFVNPISGLPLPDGFEVKFIYNEVEYDFSDFWTVFDIGLDEEPNDDLPITAAIQFVARDNMGGEGISDPVSVIIRNRDPELTIDDALVLLIEGDAFDMLQGVTAYDFEDGYLGLEDYPMITWNIEVHAIEGDWPAEPLTAIDTSYSGIYTIHYTATDVMGATDEGVRYVMVSEPPVVSIEDENVEFEFGGSFPVWNGVSVEYWNPSMLNWSGVAPASGGMWFTNVQYEFKALLDDPETGIELGDLYQFENSGQHTIYYVATVRTLEGDDYPLRLQGIEEEDIWFTKVTVGERDVNVTNASMGDFIYINDFVAPSFFMMPREVDEQMLPMFMMHKSYPVITKYNPTTGQERIYTAYDFGMAQGSVDEESFMMNPWAFDDIAVLSTGELYGLLNHNVFYIHPNGMPEWLFNTKEEVIKILDLHSDSMGNMTNIQSMTVDENDNLVMATGDLEYFMGGSEAGIGEIDHILLYFDPDGYTLEEETGDVNQTVEEGPTPPVTIEDPVKYYLVNIGLVDLGDFNVDYFDTITDLAYSSDFTTIYGIGGTYYMPEEIYDEGFDSTLSERYYELFSIEEVFPEVENTSMDLLRFFNGVSYFPIKEMGTYKGMAVLGDDIYVTGYLSPNQMMETVVTEQEPVEEPVFYQTRVFEFNYDEEFIFTENYDDVEVMFDGALGAASVIKRTTTVLPSPIQLYVGYNATAAQGVAQFEATFLPELAFGDEIVWILDTGSEQYVTNDGDGQFTAKPENIGSSAQAIIGAKVKDKATGADKVVYGVINIRRLYAPAPPTPTPTPTPTQTVAVTLDTDAVTLDYGPTADPEFTSYDFTETVTGTTNTAVTWSLDDDTYATVDENGVVTAKEDVPQGTGDITVTVTVTTVVGGATDTATILFVEQTPLGAIEFFEPYISGYTDNTFRPANYVTRAEVAAMFAKILKLNTDYPGLQNFNDVKTSHWAYPYIQAMYRAGIFSGYLDANGIRTFNPEAPISRAEIAQVFTNYWKFLDISVTGENRSTIPDVPTSHWASSAINRIYNTGIFTGFTNGNFNPEDPTLREQIVNMINKLIARPTNEPDTSKFVDIQPSHPFFGDIEAASQTFLKPQGD